MSKAGSFTGTMILGVAVVALLSVIGKVDVGELETIAGFPRSEKKPFKTFEEFYPFYLTEHTDMISRRLHVIGTSLVLLTGLINFRLLYALVSTY